MPILIGIDGGGSGCRARACGPDGTPLGEGRAGPANIVTDPDGARAAVLAAAGAALAAAGAAPGDCVAVLGLAGANISAAAAAFAATLPFARAEVVSDALIALDGALPGQDGIAAILGTGSAFLRRRGDRLDFAGGWGFALGDEAGGAWLGHALLARALRARDGIVPATPLLAAVLEAAGGPAGAVGFARDAGAEGFARLAPQLWQAAEDPAAAAILAEAEGYILAAVAALRAGEALPVALLGGLGPAWSARLAGRLPGLAVPAGGPLDGAIRRAAGLAARAPA